MAHSGTTSSALLSDITSSTRGPALFMGGVSDELTAGHRWRREVLSSPLKQTPAWADAYYSRINSTAAESKASRNAMCATG